MLTSALPHHVDLRQYPHLYGLDCASLDHTRCDMLIGSDNFHLLEHLRVIRSNQSPLVGVETRLDLMVIGPEFCHESALVDGRLSSMHTASVTTASGDEFVFNELETYFHKEFNEERNDVELTASLGDNRCVTSRKILSLKRMNNFNVQSLRSKKQNPVLHQ